ncbi:hypothetical protein, partial [Longitalea luteola]|uniref:hypothetical protein n=1 Tax=Longitalea luteola TaxID=2812563 RepID=UPI001A95F46F
FGSDTARSTGRGYYAHMRREQDASYVISGATLRFMYQHELNSSSVQLRITDISKNPQQEVALDSSNLAVNYGSNYLSLDLGNKGLINRHMYLLDLSNDRNEHWYLKFEYRQQQ